MRPPTYTHITIQPPNEDGALEVWGAYEVTAPVLGTFDSDGIIGFLYRMRNDRWVYLNEAGHPTEVFDNQQDLIGWLQSKCPSIDWAETYRQPEERG